MSPDKKNDPQKLASLTTQRRFHGVGLVVAVMRTLDPVFRDEILTSLSNQSPELARLVHRCDFLYPDLIRLDDASLLTVFNLFDERDWAVAWKLTDELLKGRISAVLRPERCKAFLDFAASLPRMPKTQVIATQIHLASQIRAMLQKGQIRARNPLTVEREKLSRLRVKSGAFRR